MNKKFISIIIALMLISIITIPTLAQTDDLDGDGIDDAIDNCIDLYNPHQFDRDGDGIGDVCDERIRTGRFAYYLEGIDEDQSLSKGDGTQILPTEVAELYGTPDGMTIYDHGLDVSSWEYAAERGWARPLRPVYKDLSIDWPDMYVEPGTVAIDPILGRFAFAGGDDDPLSVVGSTWTGFGVPGSGFIRIEGNLAVMPAGEGDFQVFDLSDPIHPQVIGHLRVDFNWVVAIYDNFAYISQSRTSLGMRVIDISDPTNPTWATSGDVWPHYATDINIQGNLAYATTDGEPGFYILDLTDPLNPIELGSVNVGDPEGATTIFVKGSWAYVALASANGLLDPTIAYGPKSAGFSIVDVSDPTNPTLLGTYLGEPDPPMSSALMGFYSFDTDASDQSVYQNDGIQYGGNITSGYEENAYHLDGVDDYIWTPVDITESSHTGVTIGAWVKADSLPGDNVWDPSIINNGSDARGLGLDNRLVCRGNPCWLGLNGQPWSNSLAGPTANTEEWVFISAVYDSLLGTSTLYLDDQIIQGFRGTSDWAGYDHSYIGFSPFFSGFYFHGGIDNAFFYGRALDEQEINRIRAGGAAEILQLGDELTIPAGEPEPLHPSRLPRLIGINSNVAILAQTWIPDNYPHSQPAKLILVDISNPLNITQAGAYTFATAGISEEWMDLFSAVSKGCYSYISDDSQDNTGDSLNDWPWKPEDFTSLLTFDICDPGNPQLVHRYDHPQPSRFRHLTLHGDYIYATDYNYGVRVFDISNPVEPSLVGGATTAAEGHYAWVNEAGTTAYFAQTFGGTIYSMDLQNQSTPLKVGEYWDGEWNEKSELIGRENFLYIPTSRSVNIIDVSDSANPVKAGYFPGTESTVTPSRISLHDNYAYIITQHELPGQGRDCLRVYDIANPGDPQFLGELDLQTARVGVFAQGEFVYVVSDKLLTIINVSDPHAPYIVGEVNDTRMNVEASWEPRPLWVKDGYAYLITGERNASFFHIVDVHDTSNPYYVDTYVHSQGEHVTNILIEGKLMYLGTYWGNLMIFDLTNPVEPQLNLDAAPLNLGAWGAGWSIGGMQGENLIVPAIDSFHLINVPHSSQAVIGPISVHANLNQSPIAYAGGSYGGNEGSAILFSGATATDPDNDPLTVSWSIDSPLCSFDDPEILNPFLTCDNDGTFVTTLSVSDGLGDPVSSQATVEVTNVPPTVEAISIPIDPVQLGNKVSISASFCDPAGVNDVPYTCSINFGDGMGDQPGIVSGMSCEFPEYEYLEPGLYQVSVTITDKDSDIGTSVADEYIVIYDPDGGFVTGGGWITSPEGASTPNPALTGKAKFRFVAKYKKRAIMPIGKTTFQFKEADLKFHSTSYDWLVVAGKKAIIKGVGIIKGQGEFNFLLMAIDGDLKGGDGIDKFRIKIWEEDDLGNHVIVYDNLLGADDDADPITELGRGSIAIHKFKKARNTKKGKK